MISSSKRSNTDTAEMTASANPEAASFLVDLVRAFAKYKLEQETDTNTNTNTNSTDEVYSSLSSSTTTTDGSSSSSVSEEEDDDELPLIAERLLRSGVCTMNDFDFVTDKVSKEVAHLYPAAAEEEKKEEEGNMISHVKTGAWEVITFEDDGTPKDTFYVVTGVSMSDRVDMKKLRKAIFSSKGKGHQGRRRPKIHMAPTSVAEALTGYKSGTMAPICHSTNMRLFLEESIFCCGGGDASNHRIQCGSGIFGKCLSIPKNKFMEVAGLNPEGFEVVSIIQKKKS